MNSGLTLNIVKEPVKNRRNKKQNAELSSTNSNRIENISVENYDKHVEDVKKHAPDSSEKKKSRKWTNNLKKNSKKPEESWKNSKLFTGNPEVPVIPMRAVRPIKEAVFSEESFENMNLHPFLVKSLKDLFSLSVATAVQDKLIPVLLKGEDALVRSQTGSGKTLAFSLPLINALQAVRPKINRTDGIYAVVIVPSRELALQTYEVFQKLVKSFTWLVPGILMGGENRKAEKARLRKGITILICTPGRLLDHIVHTTNLNLSRTKYLVIDEADRMLDLGYEKSISDILKALDEQAPRSAVQRQTVLLSATLTPGVERMAGLTLTRPTKVDTCDDESIMATVPLNDEDEVQEALVLPETLSHSYVVTPAKLRLACLTAFILDKCQLGASKMIVFMATQDMVDFHAALLSAGLELFREGETDFDFLKLHGSMAQAERTQVFNAFRKASSGVLLCTDVASRGLDLPEVDWVVQYTGPSSVADYVHRVGRTARRGETGAAVLFLATNEVNFIEKLEIARVRLQQQQMDTILDSLLPLSPGSTSMQEAATRLQNILEGLVAEESDIHDLACKAYASWVRFYASYPRNLRECFSVKSVHLGHFAKSFALREPPISASQHARSITESKPFEKKRIRDDKQGRSLQSRKSVRRKEISEFDSGLEPIPKKKKKK